MIAIEETTIHLTRGDATQDTYNKIAFNFPIYNFATQQEENYKFKPDDKITFVVVNKKGYTKEEILKKEYTLKDIGYTEETEIAELPLTEEETKRFPLSDKAQTYWYDLILNDTTTMLGFDNEGAKEIVVYPECEEEV